LEDTYPRVTDEHVLADPGGAVTRERSPSLCVRVGLDYVLDDVLPIPYAHVEMGYGRGLLERTASERSLG
jgi:hypothetical protein